MARTAKTATKTAPRKRGRPSNAERAQRAIAANADLMNLVTAAASAAAEGAVRGAIGGGTVTTLGIPQGSQSQPASTGQSTPQKRARKSPGRNVDPTSNMSKAREFYAQHVDNEKLTRADIVQKLTDKLDIKKTVANTYISNIDKENGGKLSKRSGRGRRSSTTAVAA